MRKATILIFLIIAMAKLATAQKHDYNWIMGGFVFPAELNHNGFNLSFNEDTVSIEIYEKDNEIEFYSTSYSDAEGKLRFWSNGCEIFDANANIMQGGDTLNPGLVYDDRCEPGGFFAYAGAHQSMLSLPSIGNEKNVYVFHKWVPWGASQGQDPYELRYSVIDTELNNGLGGVLEKRIPLVDNVTGGLLTAVKSADLQSWWILSPEIESQIHFIFQLTSDSIIGPKTYNEGVKITVNNHSESASSFSPDGSKYAIFGEADGLRIYDFDRTKGELSNYQFITAPGEFDGGWVGLDFSASGRFLYTCHFRKIYQYDMHAADIGASRVTVANWIDHFDPQGIPTPFFKMERAPDCRIYLAAQNGTNTIHVIHHPERKGEACMVQQNITVPAYNTMTLPSFPNYRLGTGEVCDSTKVFPQELIYTSTAPTVLNEKNIALQVFPNPSRGILNLVFENPLEDNLQFRLHSVGGIAMYDTILESGQDTATFDFSQLPNGMYFYTLTHDGLPVKTGRVILTE